MAPEPENAFNFVGPATTAVNATINSPGLAENNWVGTQYVTTNTSGPPITYTTPPKEEVKMKEYKLGNGKATTFVVHLDGYVSWPQVEAYKVDSEFDVNDTLIAEIVTRVEVKSEFDRTANSVTVEFAEAPDRNAVTLVVR